MCLHALLFYQVPAETERVARAAFPKGNLCMRLYDELGAIYSDPLLAPLFSQRGQPAESPARLALVLVLQFLENLTDRQGCELRSARNGSIATVALLTITACPKMKPNAAAWPKRSVRMDSIC